MPAFRSPSGLPVEALQWHGLSNCLAVFEFLAMPHPESHCSTLHVQDVLPTAHPGFWLVRYPDGPVSVMTPGVFEARFEPIPPSSTAP